MILSPQTLRFCRVAVIFIFQGLSDAVALLADLVVTLTLPQRINDWV
jgi:hypothetical protein